MAKDPAVLFYTSDFLSSTITFSDEQIGQYIKLLCIQHQKGFLTENDMIKVCPSKDPEVWKKFVFNNGIYFNERMQYEAERRKKFTESRKQNLNKKSHKKPHMNKHMKSHMGSHMETETETITDTITINKLEGVIGGDFETQKKYFLNDDAWKYKLCSAKNISKNEIEQLMQIFITDIELKQDYKSNKELKSHFTNWFNLKKKEYEKRNFNQYSKQARGAQQLLELIKQERASGL